MTQETLTASSEEMPLQANENGPTRPENAVGDIPPHEIPATGLESTLRAAAHGVIVSLLEVILGDSRSGLSGFLRWERRGVLHLETCRIGQAVDNYHGPLYAPCSTQCAEIRRRASAALDWLHAPRDPDVLAEKARLSNAATTHGLMLGLFDAIEEDAP